MLLIGKKHIDELCPDDSKLIEYHPIPEEEYWRLQILSELLEQRQQSVNIEGFTTDELDDMIHIICTD